MLDYKKIGENYGRPIFYSFLKVSADPQGSAAPTLGTPDEKLLKILIHYVKRESG